MTNKITYPDLVYIFGNKVKDLYPHSRIFLVGGCVRDQLIGLIPHDYDIEVYGLDPHQLLSIVSDFNIDKRTDGYRFGVFRIGNLDITIPREDIKNKKGLKHNDFSVNLNPKMSYEDACKRRDITINAIMYNIFTQEIVDPYNGSKDLIDGIIKCINVDSFLEDPIRILRVARFTSQFGFTVDNHTSLLCTQSIYQTIDRNFIIENKGIVWTEFSKLLLSSYPTKGLSTLNTFGILNLLFYGDIQNCEMVIPNIYKFSDIDDTKNLIILLTAIILVQKRDNVQNIINNIVELDPPKIITSGIIKLTKFYVENYNSLIMDDNDYRKLSVDYQLDLILKIHQLLNGIIDENNYFQNAIDRLNIRYNPPIPIITGKYLISMGINPSPRLGIILDNIYSLQLEGHINSLEDVRKYTSSL